MRNILLALTIALISACGQVPTDTVKCDTVCKAENDDFFTFVAVTIERAQSFDECNDPATIEAAYTELDEMQDDMSIEIPFFMSLVECLEEYDAEFSWAN
jgi:hypothetical protein